MVYDGHICRIVKGKVKCRYGSEKEMAPEKDFMLIQETKFGFMAFDDKGFSDPLSFYKHSLYYDHPERFPKKIREKFNEIANKSRLRAN